MLCPVLCMVLFSGRLAGENCDNTPAFMASSAGDMWTFAARSLSWRAIICCRSCAFTSCACRLFSSAFLRSSSLSSITFCLNLATSSYSSIFASWIDSNFLCFSLSRHRACSWRDPAWAERPLHDRWGPLLSSSSSCVAVVDYPCPNPAVYLHFWPRPWRRR